MENGINGINKSVRYLYTRSYDILKFNDLIRDKNFPTDKCCCKLKLILKLLFLRKN